MECWEGATGMKITEQSVREAMDRRWADAHLTEEQKKNILAQCRPQLTLAAPRRPLRRAAALAAAFALAASMSLGVAAAAPDLRVRLAGLGEYAVEQLQPVNVSDEAAGLRMEVLAAAAEGGRAVVYLTLQDTLGEGRVDDTAELVDYRLKAAGQGPGMAFGQPVDYDAATQTVTLRLESDDPGADWGGRKVKLTAGGVLSGYEYTEPTAAGVTVADIQRYNPEPALEGSTDTGSWMSMGSGENSVLSNAIENGRMPFLKAVTDLVPEEAPWLSIRSAGVVDGDLHVLVEQDGEMGRFNRLKLELRNADGTELAAEQAVMGMGERKQVGEPVTGKEYYDQWEYVFDLPADADPEAVELAYSLDAYDTYVEGDWSVTFALEEDLPAREGACEVNCGGWTARRVAVSMLGVTVEGTGDQLASDPPLELEVWMEDGTRADFWSASSSWYTDENGAPCVEMHSDFRLPTDPAQVARITLRGVEIPLGGLR